jgi:hypothetical protein
MSSPSTLIPQYFYLDLTRSVEPSNNRLSVNSLPEITSDMIKDFSIINEDISANANISGSKIQPGSGTTSGVVTTSTQDFSGSKIFHSGIFAKTSMARDNSGTALQNPVFPAVGYYNDLPDQSVGVGCYETLIQNVNTTSLNNFLTIVLPVSNGNASEISSFFDIILIGKQPLSGISSTGTTVTADAAATSTVKCLITVTGSQLTTTFFGQTSSTPFVTSSFKKNSSGVSGTTNFIIGIGFRNYSAYHIKMGRPYNDPPRFYLLNSNTTIHNQGAAQNLFDTITLPY